MRIPGQTVPRIEFAALVATTVFLMPFLTMKSTLDPALGPRLLIWAILLFILCLSLLRQVVASPAAADSAVLKRAVFPAFLGYCLFCFLSLAKAVNVAEGIHDALKTFMSFIFLLFATIILGRRPRSESVLVKAIVVSGFLLSLIGFYQYLQYGFVEKPGQSLLTGTMGHKNLFASALFLLLPFSLYAALGMRAFWTVFGAATTATMLLLILLSQTRAVYVGLLAAATVTGSVAIVLLKALKPRMSVETKRRILRKTRWVVVGCVVIMLLAGVGSTRSASVRSAIVAAMDADSLSQRVGVWQKTVRMIRDNPFLGVGAGNWKIAFPFYGLLEDQPRDWLVATFFVRPHNDFLWVWSETGVFGFLFYGAIFGIALFYALRMLSRGPWDENTLLVFLLFFGIAGYLCISFFSFPKERIFHSTILLLMIAMLTALYHRRFPMAANLSRRVLLGGLIAAQVLLLFAVVLASMRLKAEIHTKRALAARRSQDWSRVVSEIDAAYSVFVTLDPMTTPLQWYRGEAHFLSNNIAQALADYERALAAHPHHIHVLNNLATYYVLTDQPAEAGRHYAEALRIFPQFAEAASNLVAVHFNSGDYEKAHEVLLRFDPNNQNATLERYRRIVAEKLADDKPRATGDSVGREGAHRRSAAESSFADRLQGVHRLWSSTYGRHFYTIDEDERDAFLSSGGRWIDEGIVFRAFAQSNIPGTQPVRRFHSAELNTHFYAIESAEAQRLRHDSTGNWQYQGTAFYAYPQGEQPTDASPVYRFWSGRLRHHLFTMDEQEKHSLQRRHADTWTYEGVAWYGYAP